MTVRYRRSASPIALAALLAGAAGCGSNGLDSPTATRLRNLANLYIENAGAPNRGGVGFASEAELRKTLKGMAKDDLELYGVDEKDPESLLVSLRDGQPFTVVYGLSIKGLNPRSGPIVAYEKTGEAGRRLVVRLNGQVESLTAEQIERELAGEP
jgi:hypothetical protein